MKNVPLDWRQKQKRQSCSRAYECHTLQAEIITARTSVMAGTLQEAGHPGQGGRAA